MVNKITNKKNPASDLVRNQKAGNVKNYSERVLNFLRSRLRAAIDFFLSRTPGFSNCSLFLTSERIPAFSQDFLKRRKAPSKLSPSRILVIAT